MGEQGDRPQAAEPTAGRAFSPHRASVPKPDTWRFGRGCHDHGCAPHTNTDNGNAMHAVRTQCEVLDVGKLEP